jgi:hypothetical protein
MIRMASYAIEDKRNPPMILNSQGDLIINLSLFIKSNFLRNNIWLTIISGEHFISLVVIHKLLSIRIEGKHPAKTISDVSQMS